MKKQRAIITTIIAAALSVSLAGCSGAAGSSKAEAMDFQAKLELKAPDPAVGSSQRSCLWETAMYFTTTSP